MSPAFDSRRIEGLTPLHLAAGFGRFPVTKRLLAAGADPNARESGGWTPLHRAASEGHENVVRLLSPTARIPERWMIRARPRSNMPSSTGTAR